MLILIHTTSSYNDIPLQNFTFVDPDGIIRESNGAFFEKVE